MSGGPWQLFVAPPPTHVPPDTGVRCYGVTFERKFPIENPNLKKKREARKIQRADFSGELTLLFRFWNFDMALTGQLRHYYSK